jgi:nitrile hydratase alpha subunit
MSDSHGHSHPHGQPHPFQPDIEDSALTHHQLLQLAVSELLMEKGIFTGDEFRRTLEDIDSRNPGDGARVVARAWVDAEFKKRLLADTAAAAAELGVDAGTIPIMTVENTPQIHNAIVCTLCSCYPRLLLGLPPDWYKSRAYRSRVVREPRSVLAEFGTTISEDTEVRVHDSTAELRYMVLPMRPEGTEGMSEDELAKLVTRDCMVGVTLPDNPPR